MIVLPETDLAAVSAVMEHTPLTLLERSLEHDLDALNLETSYDLMLIAPPQNHASDLIEAFFPSLEPGGRMVLVLSQTCQATPGAKALLERYQVSLNPLTVQGEENCTV